LIGSSSFTLGGSDIGEVLLFSDVTDIEGQRRELQRHNEQLEEFAAGIRHELRNSLQVIKMRVNAAGGALDDGDVSRARESLSAASDRTGGVDRGVSDLATLAQYGKSIADRRQVDFRGTVDAAWTSADANGLSLTVEGEGTIEADATRLQNLFESAFVFATHNEAATVTIRLTEEGFVVSDDGSRPADENLDHLFDYGHAVPNAEAGMALPNVVTLASVHGWSVHIDESYREGVRLVIDGVAVSREKATADTATTETDGGRQDDI
jgi:light-regulated signal transduction histidine kinase (bacteriophytochrome)